MKSAKLMCITATALFGALAIPVGLAGREKQVRNNNHEHHHYKLVDIGTFGGPQSWALGAGEGPGDALSNAGAVVGEANTSNSNPNYSYPCNPFGSYTCAYFGTQDLFVEHGFRFENGALTDLGVLPGGYNSYVAWISGNGTVVGASENGVIDPLNGYPEIRAVLWKDGRIIDLGTLPGGNESFAFGVNNRGQIAGFSFDASNLIRAVRWTEDQGIQDLGTLGACCAIAGTINERGQISGESGLCDTCNQDAFLWEHGHMYRIAGFGGPITAHADLNNRGQVVGQSDLPGGANAHAFLWDKKNGMTDLGTLPGGNGSGARWINDAGDIVGFSQNGQIVHAVLWRRHKIMDLGTVDGDACSQAQNVNSESQIVGLSDAACDGTVLHAFLWEKGGPAVDLNTLVSPGSGLQLTYATDINDRGEIAGEAITSNGDNHGFLLIPCDEHHPGVDGCDYSLVDPTAVAQVHAPQGAQTRSGATQNRIPIGVRDLLRSGMARRSHMPAGISVSER
jgi:probable HAF family extracellular repeat protein